MNLQELKPKIRDLMSQQFFTKSHFGRGSMEMMFWPKQRGDLPQSWGHGRVSCQVLSWWGWMWTERWICGRGQSPKSNVAAIWAAGRTYPSSCFPKDTCFLHHYLREFAVYGIPEASQMDILCHISMATKQSLFRGRPMYKSMHV